MKLFAVTATLLGAVALLCLVALSESEPAAKRRDKKVETLYDRFEHLYSISKWPGKDGKLIDGYLLNRNELKSLRPLKDWKFEATEEIPITKPTPWAKKPDTILSRGYDFLPPSAGNSYEVVLSIVVWVAQKHCETMHWQVAGHFASYETGFLRKEPWKTDIGDVNFRASKENITFIRNNIVISMTAHGDVPVDVREVAKEIDTQLKVTKTYDSLDESKHRPKIVSFTADNYTLKPKDKVTYMPPEGTWTHLTVHAVDPMGGKLRYEFLPEPNRLGGVDCFEGEPEHFAAGTREGTAKVIVLVANQRLLLSKAELEIEIKK